MNPTLEIIEKKAVPILKKAGVKRSAIFGSQVRGEAREDSDIDMLVDLPEEMSLLDVIGLQNELENALGKKVDLVEYHTIKPRIKDKILNEQVGIL